MFWQSIIEGFIILKHWQVWVVIILCMAINFAFLLTTAKIAGEEESGGRMLTGCLLYMIVGNALQGVLMSFSIAFLLPILWGGSSTLPISDLFAHLWLILKTGIIATVIVTILCIIPIVGDFIAHSPGIQDFLEGIIIFWGLSNIIINQVLVPIDAQGSIYPGFWVSIGFLIIAGIFVKAIIFGVAFITIPLEDTAIGESMLVVLGQALGIFGGMLPLFMYTSYARLSI